VLDELSGLLGVLRRPEETDTLTEPAPGLARLAPLVETFRAAGLDLRWTSTGAAQPLPATVDLVAYRVVQEALTNAHRHGTGTVRLYVSHTPAALTLEITNPVASVPTTGGTGLGLIGMRERAGAVGGTMRVLLADDQTLIRAGFRVLIDSAPDLEVVGEAANGLEALELLRTTRADVVLMDIRMPELDGIEATTRISADDDLAGVKVLILTTFEIDDHVARAIRAGASGFLGKGVEPAELLTAIRTVAAGDALLSPKATQALISRFLAQSTTSETTPDRLKVLTQREREVVALVAHGLSNDEIAAKLFVSPLTAKTHVNRAMMKLHARDRAQLVVVAYQTGLVKA
jgi:DNA-binding NarL/FixJ family response regulator